MGSTLQNFFCDEPQDSYDNLGTTFEGITCLKFGRAKTSQIYTILDNFRRPSRISLEEIKISTSGEWRYQLRSLKRSKKWWTLVH